MSANATRMSESAYERFRALHERHEAFIMPNAWDGASAMLLKHAGFPALGTTSLGIAFSLGRQDGRHAVSLDEAIANGVLLGHLTELPVNGDLEDGFGADPQDCAYTVRVAIDAGLAGVGIEDTTADLERPIHDFDMAVERMRAAAAAARGKIVLTGRTDNYLNGRPDLDDTIRRLTAFAEAGADVLYAPGLPDMGAIRAVGRAVSPKPLNVLMGAAAKTATLADLSAAGVRRISLGGALYRTAMTALVHAAQAMKDGDFSLATAGMPIADIASLLPKT